MKQLTCELCGSTELIKQDGFFVCQDCGCKYTLEEAKKMMLGSATASGNNEKIEKYYKLARTAKEEEDTETAIKYYTLIREEDPESWEAKFYSAYYEAMESTVSESYSACVKLGKIAPSVLSSIKTNEPSDKHFEYAHEVALKIDNIAPMFLNGGSEKASDEVPNLAMIWGDQLAEKFNYIPQIVDDAVNFCKNDVKVIIETYGTGEEEIDNLVEKYSAKIKTYDIGYQVPKSNISVHTVLSPNQAIVEILNVGHTDFTVLPLVPVPVERIVAGPDSAGGVSVQLRLKNISGKTIEYATLYVTAFDQVGNPAECSINNEATRALSITGPIEAGSDSGKLIFETVWYNPTITSVRMHSMIVEYTDGTKEKYLHNEYDLGANATSDANPDEQLVNLTVMRNERKTTIIGYTVTCVLDSQIRFQLGYMETATIPVKPGTHRIDFEFKGQALVPAKCKTTSDFEVEGNTRIELTRDAVWGGFKSKIIK